ncbi:acylamino-acid-releasing enzyme-like [Tropilaelaps mercedesae]|uniref:Acylamino-acid-releasing enzyme n=1 Tax=Tropilaelaps mercedesae TaxID=418985 RepID=A0A1V9XP88_9ACAR|nr:acylamino-acid-releasing enzyme-like [Tropilaelaps mercedesae]
MWRSRRLQWTPVRCQNHRLRWPTTAAQDDRATGLRAAVEHPYCGGIVGPKVAGRAGWLSCVPENPCLALCKHCKITFTAKISDIKSHSNSNRHRAASTGTTSIFKYNKKVMGSTVKSTGVPSLDATNIVSMYRELARVPQPVDAFASYTADGRTLHLTTVWESADTEMGQKVRFTRHHTSAFDNQGPLSFHQVGHAQEVDPNSLTAISNSGSFRAVLKEVTRDTETKQYIEIWDATTKLDCLDLESAGVHGKVHMTGNFASFQWGHIENKLLYIAERKPAKKDSYFTRKLALDAERGTEYQLDESYGEQQEEHVSPVICILNVANMAVSVIQDFPDMCAPGQAVWAPDDNGIVFVGFQQYAYKLGLTYCKNRHSKLYVYDLDQHTFCTIGETDKAIYSPRFSPDGATLVYLQSEVGGPHRQSCQLMKCSWEKKDILLIVDTIQSPTSHEFPGLYIDELPRHCWAADNTTVVVSSGWHSKVELLAVNTLSGDLIKLSRDEAVGRWQGVLTADGGVNYWTSIDSDESKVQGICWYILQFAPPDDSHQIFEAILISHKNEKELPLIVWPHGGPHSVFHAGFQIWPILFVKCGFAVLLVNYRGSIGFGEDNLRSLAGKVGTQDVFDVQCAAEVTAQREEINPTKIVIFGGSHGGFLASHAIGQYPDFYKAAVMRNPVVDLSMCGPTDIPDWIWYEGGLTGEFMFDSLPDGDDIKNLWMKSPIRYAKNIVTPTLLLLGRKDKRVDMAQGTKLYKHLKARGVPTRCNAYNDGHALSKPAHDADCFVNTVLWFKKYLA